MDIIINVRKITRILAPDPRETEKGGIEVRDPSR